MTLMIVGSCTGSVDINLLEWQSRLKVGSTLVLLSATGKHVRILSTAAK